MERGLAATGRPDHGHLLSGAHREGDVAEHGRVRAVAEGGVVELERVCRVPRGVEHLHRRIGLGLVEQIEDALGPRERRLQKRVARAELPSGSKNRWT